jgi:hydroxypyruvate isomerase
MQTSAAAGALWLTARPGVAAEPVAVGAPAVPAAGRLRQSLVHWCYSPHWSDFDELCRIAKSLGCVSIELCDPQHWPTLRKHGLTCAIAGSHGFRVGFNNPGEWEECAAAIRGQFALCREFGIERIITFTGMANGIDKSDGAANCVEGLKPIVAEAEQAGVTLCLEMLNSRDDSHPMKGHPGYQGDHTDYCIDILERVGSTRLKLLFDIYHVQIMDGDVIRRIREYAGHIGHVHTAGNPGRAELNEQQEINYPAVIRALVEAGYDGFVGQEFLPTGDPLTSLQQAVAACSV